MWSIKANFVHNEDDTRTTVTLYDETFESQDEAEMWLDDNYGLLAGACDIDMETEPDLKGYYLEEIVTYKVGS